MICSVHSKTEPRFKPGLSEAKSDAFPRGSLSYNWFKPKNLRVYLLLYLKGRPISEAGQWASRASERGCVLGWSFSLLTAPSHSLLPCLPLRDMASSGVYKLDDGKPYLSNCFPAKSLLRMPEEGQVTSHFSTFASPPGPASECL